MGALGTGTICFTIGAIRRQSEVGQLGAGGQIAGFRDFNSEINGLPGGFVDVTVVASLRVLGVAEGQRAVSIPVGTVGVLNFPVSLISPRA